MPSHRPKMKEVLTDRRRVGLSPPSAIAIRKLSRLRVNPRVRSEITWLLENVGVEASDLPRLQRRDRSHVASIAVLYSGNAKANSAAPPAAPSIPGRNPSVQAPHPVGTAMYCLPSTV